jgi:uncharacterized protein (TIGR00106 family)
MLAEFSINPLEAVHMSKDMAKVVEALEQTGLAYRLGPMGTCVEGTWDEIMAAIRRCHEAVGRGHERVITTIIIDDRKHEPHHLAEMVTSVERELSKTASGAQL